MPSCRTVGARRARTAPFGVKTPSASLVSRTASFTPSFTACLTTFFIVSLTSSVAKPVFAGPGHRSSHGLPHAGRKRIQFLREDLDGLLRLLRGDRRRLARGDVPARPDADDVLLAVALAQSDSNVPISVLHGLRVLHDQARVPAASPVPSARRLWLPTKACRRSRMIVRVCSRMAVRRPHLERGAPRHRPDDPDLDARLQPLLQDPKHAPVRDSWVVDQQLRLGPLQERAECLPGVLGADDERVGLRARTSTGCSRP